MSAILILILDSSVIIGLLWRVVHMIKTLNKGEVSQSEVRSIAIDGAVLGLAGGILLREGVFQTMAWVATGGLVFYTLGHLGLTVKGNDSDSTRI